MVLQQHHSQGQQRDDIDVRRARERASRGKHGIPCTVSATGAKVGFTHTADRHAADRLAQAPNSGTRTWAATTAISSRATSGGTPSNRRWYGISFCARCSRGTCAKHRAPTLALQNAGSCSSCTLTRTSASISSLLNGAGMFLLASSFPPLVRVGRPAFLEPATPGRASRCLSTMLTFVREGAAHAEDPRMRPRREEGRRGKRGEAGDRRWDG